MNRLPLLRATALSLALAAPALPDTLVVKAGGPFPTISSAVAAASAGDTIVVEEGVYSETVFVPSALAGLRLETDGDVVIDARGPGGAPLGTGLTIAAPDVRVEDLTVRHAATFGSPSVLGVGVSVSAPRVVLKHVRVLHAEEVGFRVTGAEVRLVDCEVRRARVAVSSFGTEVVVKGGRFAFAEEDGLVLRGPRSRAVKNEVHGCGLAGIRVEGDESIVRKNDLDGNGRGIDAAADLVEIEANTIRWTLSDALAVVGDGVVVRDNSIEGTAFAGVKVDGDDATVAENEVRLVGRDGILVVGDGATVAANEMRELLDAADGIKVFGETATIVDNDVRRVRAVQAIANSGAAGSLLAGNDVRLVAGTGVQVFGDDSLMLENSVRRSNTDAFTVLGAGVTAEGNVARKSRDGFRIQGSAHVIRQNVVERSLVDGIHVQLVTAGEPPHLVADNLVVKCGGEGIEVNADGTTVRDNVCQKNRIDLAADAAGVTFVGNQFQTGGPGTAPEIE